MNGFSIELSQQAASYFKRLDKATQRRVADKLQEVAGNPASDEHSKRLVNRGGQRSARVGNLRILFELNESLRKVEVAAILPRGDVYKRERT